MDGTPQARLLTGAANHMTETMNRVLAFTKSMQPAPMGERQRTPREQSRIFEQIRQLPKEQMNEFFTAAAEKAGHQPDEDRPCELCRFMGNQISKELG